MRIYSTPTTHVTLPSGFNYPRTCLCTHRAFKLIYDYLVSFRSLRLRCDFLSFWPPTKPQTILDLYDVNPNYQRLHLVPFNGCKPATYCSVGLRLAHVFMLVNNTNILLYLLVL